MPNKNTRKQRAGKKTKRTGKVQPFGYRPLLPSNKRMLLPYAERISLAETVVGAGVSYSMSLNSLFDPNSGGIGLQPVGFDQISAMYGQYRVTGVRCKITFVNNNTGAPAMCSAFATYQPVVPSNPDAWPCQPYGASRVVDIAGSGRTVWEMTKRFDIPTVLGLTRAQYMSDMDFVGTPSGNPTRQAYLMLGFRSISSTIAGLFIYIQMEYEAEFSQPLALALS